MSDIPLKPPNIPKFYQKSFKIWTAVYRSSEFGGGGGDCKRRKQFSFCIYFSYTQKIAIRKHLLCWLLGCNKMFHYSFASGSKKFSPYLPARFQKKELNSLWFMISKWSREINSLLYFRPPQSLFERKWNSIRKKIF